MNQREKERYLRDYGVLKAQGKPFFPYAVAKDAAMAAVVMAVIISLSLVLGAELGPKADPTTTTYVPRPEWYFFFLFELLRVVKPPSMVGMAMIGIPTVGLIVLLLLPFYDRGPERRPERRPIATLTGIFVIAAMAFLTYEGANAGSPTSIDLKTPSAIIQQGPGAVTQFNAGRQVAAQSGCLACHKIGENGNDGPGPPLIHVGARLPGQAIARTLTNPTSPMPPFQECGTQGPGQSNVSCLPPEKFNALVYFLSHLK
jgi:ubiquinol-cytochrome c reductase cytochrome b subunit/menaquinol-cytochrome c reductase cytochrome b/c subunit